MHEDDILSEIRATREAFATRHNYDLDSMAAELQANQAKASRIVVRLQPRPVTLMPVPAVAPASDASVIAGS
jgi:hypothetical protein